MARSHTMTPTGMQWQPTGLCNSHKRYSTGLQNKSYQQVLPVIGIVNVTLPFIGHALLNPFNPTKTGIPLNHIVRQIEIKLLEILQETEIPDPVKRMKDGYPIQIKLK